MSPFCRLGSWMASATPRFNKLGTVVGFNTCTYIYIYIYIYNLYRCMHIHVNLYVYLYIYIYIFAYVFIDVSYDLCTFRCNT